MPIAFYHAGGIRNDLPAGQVSFRQLYQALPFEHEIYTGELLGNDLMSLLAQCRPGAVPAMCVTGVIPSAEGTWSNSEGRPIVAESWYRVAYNDFVAQGGDHFTQFSRARRVRPEGITVREALKKSFSY